MVNKNNINSFKWKITNLIKLKKVNSLWKNNDINFRNFK